MAKSSDLSDFEDQLEKRSRKGKKRTFAPANRSAFTLKKLIAAKKTKNKRK